MYATLLIERCDDVFRTIQLPVSIVSCANVSALAMSGGLSEEVLSPPNSPRPEEDDNTVFSAFESRVMVYTIILLPCDRFAWFWIMLDRDDIDEISCRFLFRCCCDSNRIYDISLLLFGSSSIMTYTIMYHYYYLSQHLKNRFSWDKDHDRKRKG
jgi:hypothetical protein